MTVPSALSRHRVIALVTAGVIAGGIGGAVISQLGVATASSPSPAPSAGARGFPGFGPDGRFGPEGPGRMGLLGGLGGGRLLHGEATVQKAGGGTMVVRFQNGVISGVTGSTMTVRSTDGFTASYTVNGTSRILLNGTDGTLSKLAKNDQVRVLAVESGSTSVAKMVLDGVPPGGMFGMHGGMGLLDRAFRHRERMMQSPAPSGGASG
ncbi:MAG TPA: hypothetical protein VFH66_16285 [Mycobacteriales bacterium]|nr:hypothetical protein [Mycobacteriales bacterium]